MRSWLRKVSRWYTAAPGPLAAVFGVIRRMNGLLAVGYTEYLRLLVLALAGISGIGILAMMGVTVCDILLRRLTRHPVPGAMDIIQIAGAITISCALPYTTAVKGHVAVEYFFQRLGHRGRLVVDTIARSFAVCLFFVLAGACFWRGHQLRTVGEVTLTLELPVFWVLHVIGFSCATSALVILHNLLHPGREMIKP